MMTSLQSWLYIAGSTNHSCLANADDEFGPIISRACHRGFDFTLMFEQSVLTIGPSAILLLVFPLRMWALYGSSKKIGPNYTRAFKILATIIYAALQLTVLVFWLLEDSRNRATIPAAILSLTASLAICCLSYFEHVRSVRPSTSICLYLFISLVFDACEARTLYLRNGPSPLVWTYTAGVGMKLVLLILESREKSGILKEPYKSLSPEEKSGVFNRTFIWWINPLIVDGYKRLLSVEDLPKINSEFAAAPLRDAMQKGWDHRPKPEGRYTLIIVSLKCLYMTILPGVPLRILLAVLFFAQPYLISRAIRYVGERTTEDSPNTGIELIGAAVVVYVGIAIVGMLFKLNSARVQSKIRAGMIGLIHNRSLTLEDGHYDESAAMTLISVDTDNISNSLGMLYESWAMILELVIGMTMLGLQVGWACVMPLVLCFFASYASALVGKHITGYQKAWSQATQKRIAKISAMLGSVKALKMMGLSEIVESIIQEQRHDEIKAAGDFRWMLVGFNIAANSVFIFAPVATFAAFTVKALIHGKSSLSTEQAFTSLALITMLSGPAQQLLTLVPMAASLMAAFDRIQKFLLDPSREDKRLGGKYTPAIQNGQKYTDEEPYSDDELRNGNGVKHMNGNNKYHNLNEPHSDWAITVDSATIRPARTAEPALTDISMKVKKSSICLIAGPVGCGKSTLAKAILGELPSDSGEISISSKRIGYCAQSAWLLNGTIRQNICGPVKDEDIDETWYQSVLNACALERDLGLLPDGDRSLIGSRGLVLSGGQKQRVALARAVYARLDIVLLDDVLSALDAKTERLVVERLIGSKGLLRKHESTVILITHATQYFHLADHIVVIGTDKKIAEQGSFDHLRSQEGYISKLLLKGSENDHHSDDEEHKMTVEKKKAKDPTAEAAADLTRKTGDTAVYKYWLESIGWKTATLFFAAEVSFAFFLTFPQYWLKWWTEDKGSHMGMYLGGYFLLSTGALITNASIIAIMLLLISPKTSAALHTKLLHKVMRAPQAFFAETDTGVTLNRFSQDMNAVDRTLPIMGMIVFMQLFKIIAQGVLLFSGQSFIFVTVPFVILIIYVIQKIYLQTSRQIRFMELETQAPVYSHFLETLEGLSTLRAFHWEKNSAAINITRLDTAMIPYYLLFCTQRWLNIVLDLLVAALAILVVSLAVSLRNTTTGAQIGISLNVILVLNSTLLRLAESYTQMETALGAIARLKNFQEQTPSEDKPGEDFIPDSQWPERGAVEFRDVTASYGPDTLALRNISLKISPGQKVGICGRTGSGKSSLLSTLLRLLDMDSGTIIIDGQDLRVLPREIIRTRMIAIPQDPFILSESVRINADPGKSCSDEKIIEALTKVNLWSIIEPRGGLEENMKEQPLSHGQQQLFCLARAMLRNSKIVILDEATSNVDRETDQLMQRIIREEFSEHTIITVAHRLDTILDSDMVAVLDAGALVEYGNPKELLKKDSVFKDLHGR